MPLNPEDYIFPENYHNDLSDISNIRCYKDLENHLGVVNLSKITQKCVLPIDGIFYGPNSRIFIPLVLNKNGICVHVIFLLDTTSPYTYISRLTFEALGMTVTKCTNININGIITPVYCFPQDINVNILGQHYLEHAKLNLHINYTERSVKISKEKS